MYKKYKMYCFFIEIVGKYCRGFYMRVNKNRLLSIELKNIKNISFGKIDFCDLEDCLNEKNNHSEITGIYGQNGSGKTTIINCLQLLKTMALGESIITYNLNKERTIGLFDYLVKLGEKKGEIKYNFSIYFNNINYEISYAITLSKNGKFVSIDSEAIDVSEHSLESNKQYPVMSYSFRNDALFDLYDGINHRSDKQVSITAKSFETEVKVRSQLLTCIQTQTSMIFSNTNRAFLIKSSNEVMKKVGNAIEALGSQIFSNLFIYDKTNEALNLMGCGPVLGVYKNHNKKEEIHGMFDMSIKPFYVKTSNLEFYDKYLTQVTYFISSFVPDFKLGKSILGNKVENNGESMTKISFYRDVNGEELPLSEESSGIRKLFLIACALAYCYGNKDCWLVVDEFDSGVFENLLGQLVEVMGENGKGQVIFTAHNLTPLERIDYKSIVFTTSNEKNRFVRFKAIHPTNNLRDLYLRALNVGGQKEALTTNVDTENIDYALYNAYKLI